jgi:hypothetical protein
MLIFFGKYQRIPEQKIKPEYNIHFKSIIFFIIIISILFFHFLSKKEKLVNDKKQIENNNTSTKNENFQNDNLIKENFFVVDSNNLDNINSHVYGFIISPKGILTDNYYKQLGEYEEPLPQGVYVMIRKIGKKIIINQDFYGSYGIYIYENKDENYFAISNSFLLLEEYLARKQNLTLNKEYADNLIVTELCSYSLEETLIKEIKQIPSNSFIVINLINKEFTINNIDYKENSIPLESQEGLQITDNWINKWGYIFRSLKKQTDNISADLSGGFDTRTMITILLNSGIKMEELNIHSIQDTKHEHDVDFQIASNISRKFGFKLNNFKLDNDVTKWNLKNTLFNTIYPKLGFHKEFYMKNIFYNKPRFSFTGSGGESLRGIPSVPIKTFLEMTSLKKILGHQEEFYYSSEKIFNRSISFLKNEKTYNNDYEISYDIYSKSVGRNHFGKSALENFMTNIYILQPLMDPDIKKIKFDVSHSTSHDLIAYIYVRFAHDLIKFPFQGNRLLDLESIKKAEILNNNTKPFERNLDYNSNFYIDNKRISPVKSSQDNRNVYDYLEELFKSSKYIYLIKNIYDNNVYNWANEYSKKTNYHPLSQHYALFAIAMTLENLAFNERIDNNIFHNNSYNGSNLIII